MNKFLPQSTEFDLRKDILNLNISSSSSLSLDNVSKITKHYHNGLSRYTENIKIEVTTNIKRCEELWKEFSPMQSLFDTWNFRYSFYQGYKFPLYFLTVKKKNEPLALLPLCYNESKKVYQWFGTDWQEDNGFFAKNYFYMPILLFLAPRPISLNAITEKAVKKMPSIIKLEKDDPKFILDVKNLKSVEDYLSSLKKKKRYNLKRDRKHIMAHNPKIVINEFSDYDEMIEICKKRFVQKGQIADFQEDPATVSIFKNIIANGSGVYEPKMVSVFMHGELAGADLITIYKDSYYPLHGGGYDTERYSGIGNFMNLIEIQDAISMGMEKVDMLQYDYGWKHSWFPETPLFIYKAG